MEAIEMACGQEGKQFIPDAIDIFTIARGEIGDVDVIVIACVRDPLEVDAILASFTRDLYCLGLVGPLLTLLAGRSMKDRRDGIIFKDDRRK